MRMAKGPPDGSPQMIPYLYYEDADAALDFLQRAFGFELEHAVRNPSSGRVLTSTLRIGGGKIMVGPGMKPFGTRGTPDPDAVSAMLYVYVDDVDAHYARAKAAGAVIRAEPHRHFGNNWQYTASDPGGQRWTFAQPILDEPTGA